MTRRIPVAEHLYSMDDVDRAFTQTVYDYPFNSEATEYFETELSRMRPYFRKKLKEVHAERLAEERSLGGWPA